MLYYSPCYNARVVTLSSLYCTVYTYIFELLVTKYFKLLNNTTTATIEQTTLIYCFLCFCTCANALCAGIKRQILPF